MSLKRGRVDSIAVAGALLALVFLTIASVSLWLELRVGLVLGMGFGTIFVAGVAVRLTRDWPRHTPDSVAQGLADDLENGSVRLPAFDPQTMLWAAQGPNLAWMLDHRGVPRIVRDEEEGERTLCLAERLGWCIGELEERLRQRKTEEAVTE